uniref:Uncharacterized protein n=1 Tax=Cannabis sativa TaxID=3483 RepID=A0A803PBZ4_CANSA
MIRPFTKKDVKVALFDIHSFKSPGPDGFGSRSAPFSDPQQPMSIYQRQIIGSQYLNFSRHSQGGTSYSLMIDGMLHGAFKGEKSFSQVTGLTINKDKSQAYFGGIKEDCKTLLLDLIKMEEGMFPLKYLGVHLRLTKWKAADCGEILDKIQRRLHNWASENLSFAGRA